MSSASRKYGLGALESIRAVVQIVSKVQCFSTTDRCNNQPVRSKILLNDDTTWEKNHFTSTDFIGQFAMGFFCIKNNRIANCV